MHKFALNARKYPNGVEVFLGMRLPNLNLYVLVTTIYPFWGLLKPILDNYINIPKWLLIVPKMQKKKKLQIINKYKVVKLGNLISRNLSDQFGFFFTRFRSYILSCIETVNIEK